MSRICSLIIPARAEYIDIVRLTLYSVTNKAGFSYEEMEDMKVAVTEACTNVVLHAYNDEERGFVEVFFKLKDDGICIRVKDEGGSFKFAHEHMVPAPLWNKDLSEITAGGLGIFMMHALMDKVEIFTDRSTEVILTKLFGRKEEMV